MKIQYYISLDLIAFFWIFGKIDFLNLCIFIEGKHLKEIFLLILIVFLKYHEDLEENF